MAPAHGPRGRRNLSQFQSTLTLLLLCIPLAGHLSSGKAPLPWAPPQHCRRGRAAALKVNNIHRNNKLGNQTLLPAAAGSEPPKPESRTSQLLMYPHPCYFLLGGSKPENRIWQQGRSCFGISKLMFYHGSTKSIGGQVNTPHAVAESEPKSTRWICFKSHMSTAHACLLTSY